MNGNKFSHYIVDDTTRIWKMATKCGKLIDKNNVSAVYFDEKQFSFTKPLCPKCAALKLIDETTGTAK